jgi:hypothetical protein
MRKFTLSLLVFALVFLGAGPAAAGKTRELLMRTPAQTDVTATPKCINFESDYDVIWTCDNADYFLTTWIPHRDMTITEISMVVFEKAYDQGGLCQFTIKSDPVGDFSFDNDLTEDFRFDFTLATGFDVGEIVRIPLDIDVDAGTALAFEWAENEAEVGNCITRELGGIYFTMYVWGEYRE